MAAIPYPAYGDYYPFATTATTTSIVFYVNPDTCASTYPVWNEVPEFIPGRRQPVWPDEKRVAKRRELRQIATICRQVKHIATAPSRCQMHRQKRKMRIQSLI